MFIWDGVKSYPHIVASYLVLRFEAFLEHVLRPFLRFTDHCYRFQWQARGSGHLHCMFWIPAAPPLDPNSDTARSAFTRYWGARITTPTRRASQTPEIPPTSPLPTSPHRRPLRRLSRPPPNALRLSGALLPPQEYCARPAAHLPLLLPTSTLYPRRRPQ